jgi:hypothetical protein
VTACLKSITLKVCRPDRTTSTSRPDFRRRRAQRLGQVEHHRRRALGDGEHAAGSVSRCRT